MEQLPFISITKEKKIKKKKKKKFERKQWDRWDISFILQCHLEGIMKKKRNEEKGYEM